MDFTILAACVATVIVAAATDIHDQRVPNWLTFPAALLAVVLHVYAAGMQGLLFSLGGYASGFALLIIFYAVGGMGAGDVKLLATVGAFLGPREVLSVFSLAAVFGAIYAVGVIVYLWLLEARAGGGLKLAAQTLLRTGFAGTGQTWEHYPKLRYALVIGLGVLASQALEEPLF